MEAKDKLLNFLNVVVDNQSITEGASLYFKETQKSFSEDNFRKDFIEEIIQDVNDIISLAEVLSKRIFKEDIKNFKILNKLLKAVLLELEN